MPDVSIRKISKDNWKKACLIKMKPEQQNLLASVAHCLARAYINPYKEPIEPFAIFADEDIIGFFWFTLVDNRANCVLGGFRIDQDYQGFGYSKSALSEILRFLEREYQECISIQLFVEKNNILAKNLYQRFGFETIHVNNDSNFELMLYRLKDNVEIELISEDCLNDE